MSSTSVLIGAIVIALTSSYLFINILKTENKKQEQNNLMNMNGDPVKNNNPFSIFFGLVCLGVFFFSLNLIAATSYESYNFCNIMVNTSNVTTGNFTVFTYGNYCFTNNGKSADGLVDLVNSWNVITLILFGGIIIYYLYQFIKNSYDQYAKP